MPNSQSSTPGPIELLKNGWDILRTVYWYNSIPWRLLKSVALVVFGFFCLSGANLLYSYKPHWGFLLWVIAYGFLLIVYGPIHHLVVIPVSLKLNHYSWGRRAKLGKRIPFWTLIAFFIAVPVMGWVPPDMMTFEFRALTSGNRPDMDPELACELNREETEILCSLSEIRGIDRVEVHSGEKTVVKETSQPFTLIIPVSKLQEVVGQKQFQVVLMDEQGNMVRRFVRTQTSVRYR